MYGLRLLTRERYVALVGRLSIADIGRIGRKYETRAHGGNRGDSDARVSSPLSRRAANHTNARGVALWNSLPQDDQNPKAVYWRQVRLFYDYLRLVLKEETHQSSTNRRFREFKKLAAQSTEFLWQRARAGLPPRPKQERTAANSVTIIGDCSLPDRCRRILDNGPKYSFEPAVQRHQLLAIARQAAFRTDVRERDRATSDAVNCVLSRAGSHPSKKPLFKYVVDTLEQRSLAILQADKEGGSWTKESSMKKP
ncbi:hypothetical protein HPB50_006373 [Hyalomma asiaticum]|uniref:Uncharacterized protein n=1 Tax=Hyalomma asiaticum TaxID=266040 RepID=A0ACB7SK38_HYAAI|nr:hypothetical protein HPB50_006373 [Hyalomma asiaticum]